MKARIKARIEAASAERDDTPKHKPID